MNDKYLSKVGQYALKGFQKRKPSVQMETIGIMRSLSPESTDRYRANQSKKSESERVNELMDVRIPIKERENQEEAKKYKDFIKKIIQKEQKSRTA